MTLPELIDNLIELSCNEMPDEARDSLDDAIDHIVSSLNDFQLNHHSQILYENYHVKPLIPFLDQSQIICRLLSN